MYGHDLDDLTVEQLLTGRFAVGRSAVGRSAVSRSAVDGDALATFLDDVVLASTGLGPTPNLELASAFAAGISTEKGDLPATAGSNVNGPAPQASGLPKWQNKKRRKNVLEVALGKLAALGLAAKLGVATGAVALAGTTIAATGALTPPVDDGVVEVVVIDDDDQVGESTDTTDVDGSTEDEGDATGEENHGATVSEAAKEHDFDEACGNHGRYVSQIARGIDPTCDDEAEEAQSDTDESDDGAEDEDEPEDDDEDESDEQHGSDSSTERGGSHKGGDRSED